MRLAMLAAVAALAFANVASAASPAAGPYHPDANGKCHAANGQFVPASLCHAAPAHPICKAGVSKPCGASCIALNKTCHK